VQNFRNAYLRDGRAMVSFPHPQLPNSQVRWLSWLEDKLVKENKEIGEWAAAAVLTRFRRQENMYA
jgi:Xaa-Pro aminopeptidase